MWKWLLVMTLLLTATAAPADEPNIVKVAGEPGVLAFSGDKVWGIVCGGLACWDRNTGEGKLYLSEEWLADFGFRDMEQDNQGRLWLAGQDGLASSMGRILLFVRKRMPGHFKILSVQSA